jgi:hypothetical protein
MGFEILYKYKERNESGNGYAEEIKQMLKKVGEVDEDIPLEKLATIIFGQFARREIWIIEVEIFEFTRKKLSFRETKGGIVIKNKKFSVDEHANLTVQDIDLEPQLPQQASPKINLTPKPIRSKQVRFVPELIDKAKLKTEGVRLTEDKVYTVLSETKHPTGLGMAYRIVNDINKEITISDVYFLPAEGANIKNSTKEPSLSWQGVVDANMPNLR